MQIKVLNAHLNCVNSGDDHYLWHCSKEIFLKAVNLEKQNGH